MEEQPTSSKLLLAALAAVSCFLFTYFYYGFYYVEYEAMFDSFYSGSLTEGLPFWSIYWLGNIGTSHLYSVLYQFLPEVEWISWILYGYLFLACVLAFYIVLELLPKNSGVAIKILTLIVIYLLVFADHNIHFLYTRVSYLVTGISLIASVVYFKEWGSIKRNPLLYFLLLLGFVVGTLTRSESALAALLLVGIWAVAYTQDWKQVAAMFALPTLFIFLLLGYIAYDFKTDSRHYKQVEPEIEAQICQRGNIMPLASMHGGRDSIRWQAARDVFWSDSALVSASFMRSILRPEGRLYTDTRQWRRVIADMTAVAYRYWWLGLLQLLLGLLVTYRQIRWVSFRSLFYPLFTLSFWLLIALQTYTVKINDRSFTPLISISILCHLIWLLPDIYSYLRRKYLAALIVISIIFFYQIRYLHLESDQLAYEHTKSVRNLATINTLAKGKILAINASSCDFIFTANSPFHRFDYSQFRKIYITDGFNMPYLPYYRRYLERECQCDIAAYPSFWQYLAANAYEVVLISTPERMMLIHNYNETLYHLPLKIEEDSTHKLYQVTRSDDRAIAVTLKVYRYVR